MDNKELTKLIKKGDKTAFEKLFKEYAPKIYHFSLSYLHNVADSEELVQDVFLKIWEKRLMLNQSGNLNAFIYKVAINTIYDFIRRKNVEHAFKDYVETNGNNTSINFTWHEVIFNEMQDRLNELIEQFPDQRRKIFKMSKQEGLTNDEIAGKLNLSKRTVENQLYRAVAYLKEHLKNEPFTFIVFLYLFYT